jgi:hypothetical protein
MVVYYSIDFAVLPALSFAFWAWLIYSLVIAPSVHLFLVMFGLVVLLNLMTSTLYAILQGDSLRLVPLTPLLDLYNPIFVNISWFAATFDEMRGSKMKWH